VTYAPNGNDPIPRVRAYVPSMGLQPFPALYCDQCSSPIDPAWTQAISAPDGTFQLNLDAVPYSATLEIAIQIGRFRKGTTIPITPCVTTTLPQGTPATILPGTSAQGDIPKIAVSAGNKDHLDAVLTSLGITEFDCYEGRSGDPKTTSTTCPMTTTTPFIADVIQNGTINNYHMAFLSCAPGAYNWAVTTHGNNATTMSTMTQQWVQQKYGRLFVTDTAYDYIAQPFPSPITWEVAAGPALPYDGANVGCSPPNNTTGPGMSYTVTVDDPQLAQWLSVGVHVLPSPVPNPAQVSILGFYNPWSAIASVPSSTKLIANGMMPLDLMSTPANMCKTTANQSMHDIPLTVEFQVPTCGRVIFSSYHTDAGAAATSAQQRIMEYLIFEAAYCMG
jgi:hypothetical protein